MCCHEWPPNFWSGFHGWEVDLVECKLLFLYSGVTSPEEKISCLKEQEFGDSLSAFWMNSGLLSF